MAKWERVATPTTTSDPEADAAIRRIRHAMWGGAVEPVTPRARVLTLLRWTGVVPAAIAGGVVFGLFGYALTHILLSWIPVAGLWFEMIGLLGGVGIGMPLWGGKMAPYRKVAVARTIVTASCITVSVLLVLAIIPHDRIRMGASLIFVIASGVGGYLCEEKALLLTPEERRAWMRDGGGYVPLR